MSTKHTLRIFLLALAIGGSFLVLRSAVHEHKVDTCKESMDEECCKKEDMGGKMSWDNLSPQFFSSF